MLVQDHGTGQGADFRGQSVAPGSPVLDFFLQQEGVVGGKNLDQFCLLDDFDVMSAIKRWMFHPDKVLSLPFPGA
jgi:hypothetical protein